MGTIELPGHPESGIPLSSTAYLDMLARNHEAVSVLHDGMLNEAQKGPNATGLHEQ